MWVRAENGLRLFFSHLYLLKKTQFSIVGNQKMCLNCMFITFFLIFKFTYTANFRIRLIAQKVENVSVYN